METTTSKDGTTLGFDRMGSGPPVVLVCGGSVDRMSNAGLAQVLAPDFEVLNYDRRGRGDSTDTLPYAIEREIEDIEAMLEAAGGSAFLYGSSSGAVLALDAAAAGLPATKLALWEPPFIVDPAQRPVANHVEEYEKRLNAGKPGDAVEYFMANVVGMPAEFVAQARTQPWWGATEKIAHTLPYDGRIMRDYSLPEDRAPQVKVPTAVLAGASSFPFLMETAHALADMLPDGREIILEGQEHNVSPEVIGPALKAFFSEEA